jgi:hypothetical protein
MTNTDFQQNPSDEQLLAEDVQVVRTSIVRRASGAIKSVRAAASRLVAHAPGTMQDTMAATRDGARATTTALQTLPDSTLRWLAASSVGLGAGLYIAGKQRLLIIAGVAPAVIMGAAIALRPNKRAVPPKSAS